MATRWMETPFGGVRIHAQSGLVTGLDFHAEARGARTADPVLDDAERQLQEYFAGERRVFDLPLASEGTEFQKKVWSELQKIGYGETSTYGDVAHRLGYEPAISRAVGAALGANPLLVFVPCHRVVAANGSLTGYAGGIEIKEKLLELESPVDKLFD